MRKPTLEEVKEYFKDVETVKSIFGTVGYYNDVEVAYDNNAFFTYDKRKSIALWREEYGYAKILSYKTPRFEITKEQILEMAEWGNSRDNEKVRGWFPEAFEVKVDYNKPFLSLNDLLSVWSDLNETDFYKTSPLFKSFEQLAKNKII